MIAYVMNLLNLNIQYSNEEQRDIGMGKFHFSSREKETENIENQWNLVLSHLSIDKNPDLDMYRT